MPIRLDDALAQENSWSDGYYNAVRFYFWAPELLSKVTLSQLRKQALNFPGSEALVEHFVEKIDGSPGLERRTFEKLDRQEEPFNHQLEIFLRLSPKAFLDQILAEFDLPPFKERPAVLTRTVEQVWPGTQPDILLLAEDQALALEVKPPHGRSFEGQLAKYALLFRNIRRTRPSVKATNLIFLANGSFTENLPTRTPTLEAFNAAEKVWATSRKRAAFKALSDRDLTAVCACIDELEPRFLSFDRLRSIADEQLGPSETERLLYDGLFKELVRRGYCNP